MNNAMSRDMAYRTIASIGWPENRAAFIADCGEYYGKFDLLEAYIDSKSGDISLSDRDRTAYLEMLDQILARFDPKDHAYQYVSAIKMLVSLA